jgi:hypothetical protein
MLRNLSRCRRTGDWGENCCGVVLLARRGNGEWAEPMARRGTRFVGLVSREDRFLPVGHSLVGRMLLVVHAERGDRIRLISAREPTLLGLKDYRSNA